MSDQLTKLDLYFSRVISPTNTASDTDVDTESVFDLADAAGGAARAVSLFGGNEREGMTCPNSCCEVSTVHINQGAIISAHGHNCARVVHAWKINTTCVNVSHKRGLMCCIMPTPLRPDVGNDELESENTQEKASLLFCTSSSRRHSRSP